MPILPILPKNDDFGEKKRKKNHFKHLLGLQPTSWIKNISDEEKLGKIFFEVGQLHFALVTIFSPIYLYRASETADE